MKLYPVYSLYPVTPVKGQGAYIYDDKGVKYLDFYGGHAVLSIGHSHPHYVKTISKQLQQLGFYSNLIVNHLQEELAEKLSEQSGLSHYELFLINSGAEANENALKLASFYNQRKKIIALTNGFHGRTSAAINVTHSGQKNQAPINQGIPATYFDFQDIDKIINEINKAESAAIILEAIQGIGGLDSMDAEHLLRIEQACHATDTIFIMDEVQCGYGRSGSFFAFQNANVQPDIITIAKGMGNGFPIGGVMINNKKMPAVKGRLGTTYGGNHLACAAGIAVLEVIKKENLIDNAKRIGLQLRDHLSRISTIKQVKGRGLMMGIEFDFPIAELRRKLIFDHQIFTGSAANPNLLRILPPLNINENHVDEFLDKLTNGLSNL